MPPLINPKLPISKEDLENLQASGLTDETIRANKLRTVSNKEEMAKILNRLPDRPGKQVSTFCYLGGLVFPYLDLAGNDTGFARVRPHFPRVSEGKPVKYEQPVGESLRAYYPKRSREKLRDGTSPIYITEGEKKALALSQLGLAAVGIGGIWCGCQKDEAGEYVLIDDLALIPWTDRVVYIVFDYDEKAATRREADAARRRMAKALKAAGVGEVYAVELPPGPGGRKQGVDDFLVAKGNDAFYPLVEKAIPVIKIIPGVASGYGGNSVIKIIPPLLGEAAYHGWIGEFLRAVGPHTEATDAAILAHLLPSIGTLIGPDSHVYAGGPQPARVNTLLVGPTSTGRKGTSLSPVDELMKLVDAKFWQEQRVGGLSTGEGLVAKVADKKKTNEDGEEEIIPVEKRLYVVEEEFSKVLAQIRRDGNVLSQILRESYDSGNLSVMTRNNPLQAFGAHVSITGHITPEELWDRFNHVEMCNGFGNRFAWFAVRSEKIIPRCEPIPNAIYQRFVPRLRSLMNCNVGVVPLADACKREWEEEIYPYLREDRPGFAGALVARGSSIVLRIALIYYFLDLPTNRRSQGIGPEHLAAAMAVWRYCEESVVQLFGARSGTTLGDKILELLANGPMTKDELNDHLSPKQKVEVGGALDALLAAGKVRKTTTRKPGPGRPATVWELVS